MGCLCSTDLTMLGMFEQSCRTTIDSSFCSLLQDCGHMAGSDEDALFGTLPAMDAPPRPAAGAEEMLLIWDERMELHRHVSTSASSLWFLASSSAEKCWNSPHYWSKPRPRYHSQGSG